MNNPEDLKFVRDNFYKIRDEIEESILRKDRDSWCLKSIEYHDCPWKRDDLIIFTVLSCEFKILQWDRMREITEWCEWIELDDEFYYIIFEYNPDTHKFEFTMSHA